MAAKKDDEEKTPEKDKNNESEEGYYCIYCGDYVEAGQLHHH